MEKITMKEKIDVQKPDDLGLDISDLRYFLVMLLFSAVVFFLLISQRLTNTFADCGTIHGSSAAIGR